MANYSQVLKGSYVRKNQIITKKVGLVPVYKPSRKQTKSRLIILNAAQHQVDEEQEGDTFSSSFVDAKDFWEGEEWEWIGSFGKYFVPLIVLLSMVVGGIAAITYEEDNQPLFTNHPTVVYQLNQPNQNQ